MTFDRNTPFNDLPLLPPAGAELETLKVLKKTIAASRALAELKGLGGTIPNQAYYRKLRDVTEHKAWEEWVLFMLDAVEQTANQTRERITAIRKLLGHTLEDAKTRLPAWVYSKDLIELIFRQLYTKAQFIVDAGLAERKTAASYFKELEKTGILSFQKVGRENLYLNVKLYDCLTA